MRLIDADALVENLELMYEHQDDKDEPYNIGVRGAINMAKKAPTIEPKRGEWIDEADKYDASFGIHDYRCSNCNSYADEYIGGHEWYTAGKPNYCPYCGADMRGKDDEQIHRR